MKKEIECLQCGYKFQFNGASKDVLGWHTTCPKCGGSFDIDIEKYIPMKIKVKDIISEILDNYLKIIIEEVKGMNITKRWVIEPHSGNYTHIPKDVWNREVWGLNIFYDSFCIFVEAEED